MFTIVDFSKGYHNIKPDETNSFLITFNTPFGRFRFTKMLFGMTVAGDAFQFQVRYIRNLDF